MNAKLSKDCNWEMEIPDIEVDALTASIVGLAIIGLLFYFGYSKYRDSYHLLEYDRNVRNMPPQDFAKIAAYHIAMFNSDYDLREQKLNEIEIGVASLQHRVVGLEEQIQEERAAKQRALARCQELERDHDTLRTKLRELGSTKSQAAISSIRL